MENGRVLILCVSFSVPLIISAYIPGLEDRDIAFLTNGGG